MNLPGVALSNSAPSISSPMKQSNSLPVLLVVALLFGGLPAALQQWHEWTSVEGHGREIGATVVMYSTKWCPYCHRAREYFKRHSIDYVEHDIEASAEKLAEFRKLGGRGVPLILLGDKRLEGFSASSFNELLE
jgi:glutaredoxin